MGVETDDTGLIGLGNVGEDAVDHADEHAVLERVTGVLNDGDNVGAVGGHVDKISAGTVGELDSEDGTSRTDDIGNVRDGSTRGSTEVEDLAAGLDVNVVHTTENTGGQLRTERVPDTVFGLGRGGSIAVGLGGASVGGIDADALLAVDGLTGGQVLGDEEILLAASNEHTGVSVGLLLSGSQQSASWSTDRSIATYNDDLGTTLCASGTTTSASTATTVTAATSSSGCEGHFECVGMCVVGLGVCWCKLDMRAAFAKVEPRAMKLSKSCSTFSLGKPNYSR